MEDACEFAQFAHTCFFVPSVSHNNEWESRPGGLGPARSKIQGYTYAQ